MLPASGAHSCRGGVLGTLTMLFFLCAGDRFAGIMGGRTSWGILGFVVSQTEEKGVCFFPRFHPRPVRAADLMSRRRWPASGASHVSGAGDCDVRVSPAAEPPHPSETAVFYV